MWPQSGAAVSFVLSDEAAAAALFPAMGPALLARVRRAVALAAVETLASRSEELDPSEVSFVLQDGMLLPKKLVETSRYERQK